MDQQTDPAPAAYVEMTSDAERRLDYQMALGQMIYRSLVAVNGGGLIALLVIFRRLDATGGNDPRLIWIAFALFAFGLFATIASGIGAFLAQRCYYDVALLPKGAEHDAHAHRSGCMGDTMLVGASVCVIVAALAFLTGAGFAMAGAI